MTQRENQAFWDLRDSAMEFTPAQWDEHYRALAPWLVHENAEIRSCTVERLTMAALWAEQSCVPFKERDDKKAIARLAWLLNEIETAHATHADVIPCVLGDLRYKGNSEPFRTPLQTWLGDLLEHPRNGVRLDIVEGTLLLLQPSDDKDWPRLAARWIALLDHPSEYVRACAARRLGDACYDELVDPTDAELLAIISAKELERPGVAGPFWSFDSSNPDPEHVALWMLDLLERRHGEAPHDMAFNDIAFHLHELCSYSPELVLRMMAHGFDELAAMTATEETTPVEGMEPVLVQLSLSHNRRVAGAAAWHLHHVYGHRQIYGDRPSENDEGPDDAQT
jgi:hypothetical protein